jgi:TonB family protein
LLWLFVFATVSVAAFAGYFITSQFTGVPEAQSTSGPREPRGYLKGAPVAAGDLAGKSITLAEAECPIYDNDVRRAGASKTVNVRIKLDKNGKVYWARAEGGDEALRTAATEAATNSTFSPDKLRGRETEGTITYTFTP